MKKKQYVSKNVIALKEALQKIRLSNDEFRSDVYTNFDVGLKFVLEKLDKLKIIDELSQNQAIIETERSNEVSQTVKDYEEQIKSMEGTVSELQEKLNSLENVKNSISNKLRGVSDKLKVPQE